MTHVPVKLILPPNPTDFERAIGALLAAVRDVLALEPFPLFAHVAVVFHAGGEPSLEWRFVVVRPQRVGDANLPTTPTTPTYTFTVDVPLRVTYKLPDHYRRAAAIGRELRPALESARAYHYSNLWC